MVVEWAKREAEKARAIIEVDVRELGLKVTENGKEVLVETLPAMDLTNEQFMMLQRDPEILKSVGSLSDFMSPRSQNFTIAVTIRRLKKGNPKLDLDWQWIKKNWTTTKTLKLVGLVSKAFGETEKNLLDSENPTPDSSS